MEQFHNEKLNIDLLNTNNYLLSYTPTKYSIFMEEAATPLHGGGGLVWPPRSYTCTFCKREFRSAQALGGHMNVHRRDRARIKHQSTVNEERKDIIQEGEPPFGDGFHSIVTRPRIELSIGSVYCLSDHETSNHKRLKKCGSIQREFLCLSDGYSSCCTATSSIGAENIDLELRLG